MHGIIIGAIGIVIAAFGAIYPLRSYLTLTKEKAADVASPRFGHDNPKDNIKLPLGEFLREQRRDSLIAMPIIVTGIALQIVGLTITVLES